MPVVLHTKTQGVLMLLTAAQASPQIQHSSWCYFPDDLLVFSAFLLVKRTITQFMDGAWQDMQYMAVQSTACCTYTLFYTKKNIYIYIWKEWISVPTLMKMCKLKNAGKHWYVWVSRCSHIVSWAAFILEHVKTSFKLCWLVVL